MTQILRTQRHGISCGGTNTKRKKMDKWQELDIRRQTVVVCFRNPVHTANSTPTKFHHLDILQH